MNWEVTNFLTLYDDNEASVSRDFLVMGVEGVQAADSLDRSEKGEEEEEKDHSDAMRVPKRTLRNQLWMCGNLQKKQDDPTSSTKINMTYNYGGYLDHGCLYAANSFHDPVSSVQTYYGWIDEEDLPDPLRHRQGWSGLLSLPRELRLQCLRHITSAWRSDLHTITSIELEPDSHGTATLRTLSSVPVPRVVKQLRRHPAVHVSHLPPTLLRRGICHAQFPPQHAGSARWELDCAFKVARSCRGVGVRIGYSAGFDKAATLLWTPDIETFTVERPGFVYPGDAGGAGGRVNSRPERAPHTLFSSRDPVTGEVEMERLRVRVWRDGSVLEVFVNERTVVSTRVYAEDGRTFGIRFFADDGDDGGGECTELLGATVWDGIGVCSGEFGLDDTSA